MARTFKVCALVLIGVLSMPIVLLAMLGQLDRRRR